MGGALGQSEGERGRQEAEEGMGAGMQLWVMEGLWGWIKM